MRRTPPELPSGWYLVAWSDELPADSLLRLQYLEREHLRRAAPAYSNTYETREGSKE